MQCTALHAKSPSPSLSPHTTPATPAPYLVLRVHDLSPSPPSSLETTHVCTTPRPRTLLAVLHEGPPTPQPLRSVNVAKLYRCNPQYGSHGASGLSARRRSHSGMLRTPHLPGESEAGGEKREREGRHWKGKQHAGKEEGGGEEGVSKSERKSESAVQADA